jgi:predicted nucleic acid-binding protein
MKTYVLDASALIAFLQKSPGAYKVNELLKDARQERAKVLMSAVNYGEAYGKILRDRGPERARISIQAVSPLVIEVMDATPQRACAAADVKAKHALYYADSFAAALALEHKATLVTSDSDFRRLGRSFPVLWLKNLGSA